MLGEGSVLRPVGGKLSVADAQADHALHDIFINAEGGDTALGAKGIAVPLAGRDGERHVAHVLPLTSGARRKAGTAYSAVAAVFVRKAALDLPHPLEALADAYKLTPAEMRVLMTIVQIGGVPEVAPVLGISEATVKTHLQRIFDKTGTSRQADLKLVAGYSPLRLSGGNISTRSLPHAFPHPFDDAGTARRSPRRHLGGSRDAKKVHDQRWFPAGSRTLSALAYQRLAILLLGAAPRASDAFQGSRRPLAPWDGYAESHRAPVMAAATRPGRSATDLPDAPRAQVRCRPDPAGVPGLPRHHAQRSRNIQRVAGLHIRLSPCHGGRRKKRWSTSHAARRPAVKPLRPWAQS
jgi:DNA-binding CsgD family transcriptional regulator